MPTPQPTTHVASLPPPPVRIGCAPVAFRRPRLRPGGTIAACSRPRGFTLIELIITVAVIGILAAIAMPSYSEYMKRSHRSSVQSLMLDLANREQQYLLDNRSFLGGTSAVTTLLPSGVPTEVSNFYTLTITTTAGPPPTFEVKATPNTGSVMAGESPFTLDQNGTKLPAGKWQGR